MFLNNFNTVVSYLIDVVLLINLIGLFIIVSRLRWINALLFAIIFYITFALSLIISGADFIGVLYFIVYLGAIMTLFLFAIMFLHTRSQIQIDASIFNSLVQEFERLFNLVILFPTVFFYFIPTWVKLQYWLWLERVQPWAYTFPFLFRGSSILNDKIYFYYQIYLNSYFDALIFLTIINSDPQAHTYLTFILNIVSVEAALIFIIILWIYNKRNTAKLVGRLFCKSFKTMFGNFQQWISNLYVLRTPLLLLYVCLLFSLVLYNLVQGTGFTPRNFLFVFCCLCLFVRLFQESWKATTFSQFLGNVHLEMCTWFLHPAFAFFPNLLVYTGILFIPGIVISISDLTISVAFCESKVKDNILTEANIPPADRTLLLKLYNLHAIKLQAIIKKCNEQSTLEFNEKCLQEHEHLLRALTYDRPSTPADKEDLKKISEAIRQIELTDFRMKKGSLPSSQIMKRVESYEKRCLQLYERSSYKQRGILLHNVIETAYKENPKIADFFYKQITQNIEAIRNYVLENESKALAHFKRRSFILDDISERRRFDKIMKPDPGCIIFRFQRFMTEAGFERDSAAASSPVITHALENLKLEQQKIYPYTSKHLAAININDPVKKQEIQEQYKSDSISNIVFNKIYQNLIFDVDNLERRLVELQQESLPDKIRCEEIRKVFAPVINPDFVYIPRVLVQLNWIQDQCAAWDDKEYRLQKIKHELEYKTKKAEEMFQKTTFKSTADAKFWSFSSALQYYFFGIKN